MTALKPANGTIALADRFWHLAERSEGCWRWRGPMKPQGYGCISVNGRVEYAHRVAWQLTHKETVPEGLVIDHICLNRSCVNPSHLRTTTRGLNNEYRPRGRVPIPASGLRGVYRNGSKWAARVKHGGVVYNLGCYEEKEDAGRVAAAKRNELFKFPEYLGEVK